VDAFLDPITNSTTGAVAVLTGSLPDALTIVVPVGLGMLGLAIAWKLLRRFAKTS
jgi:hypothetical protein